MGPQWTLETADTPSTGGVVVRWWVIVQPGDPRVELLSKKGEGTRSEIAKMLAKWVYADSTLRGFRGGG